MIIGIPIPHNYFASWEVVRALNSISSKYKVIDCEGPYIYMNRNKIMNHAKANGQDLLMIDSDIVFKPEDVEKIAGHLKTHDAVTGVYVNTLPPYPPMIFERVEGDYKIIDVPEKFSPIGACGGGFLALSHKLMMQLPYEACNNIKEGEVEHGEDISLCHRINKLGYKIWCDPEIKLGQVRTKIIYG